MRSRRTFLAGLGLTTAIGLGAVLAGPAMAQHTHEHAAIGKRAPHFALMDAAGTEHKLSDYKGKIVVLQWINPDCPVCRRVTGGGLIANMAKKLKAIDKDVVHLAINSTHYMEASKSAAYLKEHKLTVPGLIDKNGNVGHIYGARTTPHMFVIDREGILRYSGALDDDRPGKKGDEATNYVVNAVRQIAAGETVSPDSTKPYGCSVKYKR